MGPKQKKKIQMRAIRWAGWKCESQGKSRRAERREEQRRWVWCLKYMKDCCRKEGKMFSEATSVRSEWLQLCMRSCRDSGAVRAGSFQRQAGLGSPWVSLCQRWHQVTAPDFRREKCFRSLPALYHLISGKLHQEKIHPSAQPGLVGAICSRFLS